MASPITTVRDELSLIGTIVELLKQEQRALVAADTDALNAVTPQKSQLVGQMGALARQRHQALAAAGLSADDAAMPAWLEAQADPAATSLWQDLLAAALIAKELNRVNGMLIAKQLSHNQTILQAMRTPVGAADTGVYGPTGHTSVSAPSRRLVVG